MRRSIHTQTGRQSTPSLECIAILLALLFAFGCGPAERGERCGDDGHTNIDCGEGLECQTVPSKEGQEMCVAPGKEGHSCEEDQQCDGELICVESHCSTIRDEGQRCVVDRQCDGELQCSPTMPDEPERWLELCVAPGALGASCTQDAECDDPMMCIEELCRRTKQLDDTCVAHRQCADDLRCLPEDAVPGGRRCLESQ